MDGIIVVKIGGSTLGSHDTTLQDVVALQKEGKKVIVVHGGGKIISDWLSRQGVATKFIRGERVTDKPTLDVVTAVLAGLVNKEIVADINHLGGKAVGISGVDASTVQGRVKDPAFGYVGIVQKVDTALLTLLLGVGFIPVLATVGLAISENNEDPVKLLNINADTAAGEIAAAVGAESLLFLTDVPGVADKSGKVLRELSADDVESLIASGVASGGMIPKLEACLKALDSVGSALIIDGRQAHSLLKSIRGELPGTVIKRN